MIIAEMLILVICSDMLDKIEKKEIFQKQKPKVRKKNNYYV